MALHLGAYNYYDIMFINYMYKYIIYIYIYIYIYNYFMLVKPDAHSIMYHVINILSNQITELFFFTPSIFRIVFKAAIPFLCICKLPFIL